MEHNRISYLKDAYDLIPHPEGGYYKQVFCSEDTVTSPKNQTTRNTLTHIYFLLTESDVSRWHKVVHDEIWNVYEGDPLRIMHFNADDLDESIHDEIIGDISSRTPTAYHKVISGGEFQAATTIGSYTFLGCTVAPGFNFEDLSYIDSKELKQWVINQGHDYSMFL